MNKRNNPEKSSRQEEMVGDAGYWGWRGTRLGCWRPESESRFWFLSAAFGHVLPFGGNGLTSLCFSFLSYREG